MEHKEKNRALFAAEQFCLNHWAGVTTRVRSLYWRHMLGSAPRDFVVNGKVLIKGAHHVSVGSDVTFSEGVYINARVPVVIGDHCRLSAFVRINTRGLSLDTTPEKRFAHKEAPVHIGNYVWLATGVTVNAGVTIGEGAVVGAGAVVTRDLPPYTLSVGIPAKPVRDLPRPAKNS